MVRSRISSDVRRRNALNYQTCRIPESRLKGDYLTVCILYKTFINDNISHFIDIPFDITVGQVRINIENYLIFVKVAIHRRTKPTVRCTCFIRWRFPMGDLLDNILRDTSDRTMPQN